MMRKSMRLPAVLLIALLAVSSLVSCKKSSDDSLDFATLLVLATFRDNGNGTVSAPGGYTIAKCAYGQVWNAALNNCAGTGSSSTYGAQSLAYCTVANSCHDAALNASSGPAFAACSTYSVSSITGWRLPTVAELQAMTSSLSRSSLILLFTQTPDDKYFWSRETNPNKSDYSEAYGISFADSTFGDKTSYNKVSVPLYVRCVK
jgi:hypothetical protein